MPSKYREIKYSINKYYTPLLSIIVVHPLFIICAKLLNWILNWLHLSSIF